MTAFQTTVGKNWDGTLSGATGSVTYTPSLIDQNGVAIWIAPGAVYDADKRFSMSVRRPVKGSQVIRAQLKLMHPVMDPVDSTLKIGENLVNVEYVFSKRSTVSERNLLQGHLCELLHNSAEVDDLIVSLASIY